MGARGSGAALATVALLGVQEVSAQERLFTFRASAAVQWEDNVFRLPADAPDPQLARGISGRSDRATTATLGLTAAKAYAQQRFLLDLSGTATKYQKFAFLDREAINYRGEWQGNLTPYFNATVGADRAVTPVPFDLVSGTEANEVVLANRRVSGAWTPFGRLQFLAGAQQTESRYRRATAIPSSDYSGTHVGVGYSLASGTSVTLLRRDQLGSTSGGDPNDPLAVRGDFRVRETDLSGTWTVTGRSTLNGRLSYSDRTHQDVPERDFSGRGTQITHLWTPTGRLSLTTSLQRQLSPYILSTQASYRDDRTLSLSPGWQLFEKLQIVGTFSRQETDFGGQVAPAAGSPRRDDQRRAQLAVEWNPTRNLALRARVAKDRRSSSDPLQGFEARSFGVDAAFTL